MSQFYYGVIEGFYGRQWSWPDRNTYAAALKHWGFDCYIYAPKGEAALRSEWRKPISEVLSRQLVALGQAYHREGLRWGIGLSPLGLSSEFNQRDQQLLVAKVSAINALGPDILCILFDDMRGDAPDLARRQLAVIETILAASHVRQHIVCPTYYSFDPVLEEVFGKMPADYWQVLNAGLPADVGLFWTGNRVISNSITEQDARLAAASLGRKPTLWDNYPVNDGRKTASHLHLRPYSGRPASLQQHCAGHLVNPMNQAHLSKLVLQSLQCVYHPGACPDDAWQRAMALVNDEALALKLTGHRELFQDAGLEAMPEQQRLGLIDEYVLFDHPVAAEIVEWLKGEYVFDPACLTD